MLNRIKIIICIKYLYIKYIMVFKNGFAVLENVHDSVGMAPKVLTDLEKVSK